MNTPLTILGNAVLISLFGGTTIFLAEEFTKFMKTNLPSTHKYTSVILNGIVFLLSVFFNTTVMSFVLERYFAHYERIVDYSHLFVFVFPLMNLASRKLYGYFCVVSTMFVTMEMIVSDPYFRLNDIPFVAMVALVSQYGERLFD